MQKLYTNGGKRPSQVLIELSGISSAKAVLVVDAYAQAALRASLTIDCQSLPIAFMPVTSCHITACKRVFHPLALRGEFPLFVQAAPSVTICVF